MARGRAKSQRSLTEEMAALLAKELLPDLVERADQQGVQAALRERWEAEKAARRTADKLEDFVAHTVEQVGAAWILSCLFVRVLEGRGLLSRRRIAGEGSADSQQQFFEVAPALTERDYLLTVFRELRAYPGVADVFAPAHNPAWRLSPSNDKVRLLLETLRQTDGDGQLRFRFEGTDTRFLGDLYQDLSEGVRKRYALLQTPGFIERFILDQTLEPAIAEFGLGEVRVIDPTCGSGHFLLGAFHRLFEHRQRAWPDRDAREHATAALAQVYGVDVNPYAVAIARFRLTLAFLERVGIASLEQAPRVVTNVVVADSLLHGGTEQSRLSDKAEDRSAWGDQMFALDDEAEARRVFGQRYHAVVGNPPYITCKDPVLREEYRRNYESAAGKYALSAPFTERFFQLAVDGGFVGMINANSFIKREFGKALIEKVLPRLDLAEVVDTSGAYIPGHGTPTLLLFGRNQQPVSRTVRAVMGKRGEPSTPEDAEKGLVWSSVAEHHREVGFENDYISVADVPRATFDKHPWSLGGGGAVELKEILEERCEKRLTDLVDSIGFGAIMGEDDVFTRPRQVWHRLAAEEHFLRDLCVGEQIRDWALSTELVVAFPYNEERLVLPEVFPRMARQLWPFRRLLLNRPDFSGKKYIDVGRPWHSFHQISLERFRIPLSIAFAFVATHNHFVLDRGAKVFKQSAPIIKLPPTATEEDHLALLAYLNSSTACFWMKQVFYPKGSAAGDVSTEKMRPQNNRFEFTGTGLAKMPLPSSRGQLPALAAKLEQFAATRLAHSADEIVRKAAREQAELLTAVAAGDRASEAARARMVAVQEDLDWHVYSLLDLASGMAVDLMSEEAAYPPAKRPFCAEAPPATIGDADANIWRARRAALESSPELALLETAMFKRPWLGAQGVFGMNVASYQERAAAATRKMIAEQAEEIARRQQSPISLRALTAQFPSSSLALARFLGTDDLVDCLRDCIQPEAVPFLTPLVLTPEGLTKRALWEDVWQKQRDEDLGRADGPIPVPAKYEPDDYIQFSYWSLRGKVDVPKERFISYPGCERDDDKSPLIGWAGWDHLQRAQALAALFQERKEQDGWDATRLTPILAGLLELVPWLKQWHNDPDPAYDGQRMGNVYAEFASEKARELGLTIDEIRNWRPSRAAPGRRRRPAAAEESSES